MSDIVERLLQFEGSDALGDGDFSVCIEAATEITRLRAELAEANAIADLVRQERDVLLKPVMDMTEADSVDDDAQNLMVAYYWLQQCNLARAELAEARDKALDEAAEACEAHPEEGSEDLGPGIALAIEIIRARKSQQGATGHEHP